MKMLKPLLRWVSPPGAGARLSTLIFHRVLPTPDSLFPGETDAARFDAICRWVAGWFNVLPLDEAVRRLKARTLPARALAITFDDGYADNYDVALPILAHHHLPATFFVATGFLDGGRMWNDTVIEAIRRCAAPHIDLRGLGLPADGLVPLRDAGTRRRTIDSLLQAIKYLPLDERLAAAARIAERAGAALDGGLMMTSSQVRALRAAGMQIGAHTISHPILARLPDDVARAEIVGSKRRLETILDEPVTLFAYPNGRPQTDYAERSVALVREAGFEAAVSTAKGVADASTDPFQIPRFTPWDRSRLRFGIRLADNLWRAPVAASVPA